MGGQRYAAAALPPVKSPVTDCTRGWALLVAPRSQFSDNGFVLVASQAAEGQGPAFSCLIKFGQQAYRTNLISRIEFVTSVYYKFLPNTDFNSVSLAFSMPLATSVSVYITEQR